MMITWRDTPANSSTHGLVTLLLRTDWSASDRAAELRNAASRLADDPDDTIRMLAAPALPALFADPAELREELARRLLSEPAPSVRIELLAVMLRALARHPDYIDDLLSRLAGQPAWLMLSLDPEPVPATPDDDPAGTAAGPRQSGSGPDTAEVVDDDLLQALIALSIMYEQPFATRLLETWLASPADHPARARRICTWLRPYLNPDPGHVTDPQTERAFELLALPIAQAVSIWETATKAPSAAADQAAKLRNITQVSVSIGRELRLASGAPITSTSSGTPATGSFAKRAFPILENLARISHPAVVHTVIETLDHISGHDPRRAFLAVEAAATTGHGYQWERQGADLIVEIIDRYAADHRSLLLTDPACLTALRLLLEVFVRSGWDQAIDRVQSLSEFLY